MSRKVKFDMAYALVGFNMDLWRKSSRQQKNLYPTKFFFQLFCSFFKNLFFTPFKQKKMMLHHTLAWSKKDICIMYIKICFWPMNKYCGKMYKVKNWCERRSAGRSMVKWLNMKYWKILFYMNISNILSLGDVCEFQ